MSYTIRIAVVGPVSTGKSTLINSIFINQYSDMKIKRTTMLPQVYLETTNKDNIVDAKVIYSRNQTINENILSGKVDLNNDNCQEITHLVPQITDIIKMPDNVYLEFYDLPGLDDGKQEKIYFDYLNFYFDKFDIILFNIDINEALNTSGSVHILDELLDNIKKSYSKKYLYVIINKCDNMDYNEITGNLTLPSEELEEMYCQIINTVNEKIKNINNIQVEFIKLSALDSYIYRMLNKDPHCKLDDKDRDKFGINEYGKKWKKMSEEKKIQYIQNCLKEDYEEKLIVSGFRELINLFSKTLNSSNQLHILLNHLNQEIKTYFNELDAMYLDFIKVNDISIHINILFDINISQDLQDTQNINYELNIKNIITKTNEFYIKIINLYNTYYIKYESNEAIEKLKIYISNIFEKYFYKLNHNSGEKYGQNIINIIINIYEVLDKDLRSCIEKIYTSTLNTLCIKLNNTYLENIKKTDLYTFNFYIQKFVSIITNIDNIIINNQYITEENYNFEEIFNIVSNNILTHTPKVFTLEKITPIMNIVKYFMENLNICIELIKPFYQKWLLKKYLDYDLFMEQRTENTGTFEYINKQYLPAFYSYYKKIINEDECSYELYSNHMICSIILGKILFSINITYYHKFDFQGFCDERNEFQNLLEINHDIDKFRSMYLDNHYFIKNFGYPGEQRDSFSNIIKSAKNLRYTDFIKDKSILTSELEYYYELFENM